MSIVSKALPAAVIGLMIAVQGARADDIKIGMSGPTSGAEAYFGNTWMNGAELAIKEVNDGGGIGGRKIALVRQDDQGDPKQGTLVAQRFCDDTGVLAVIAHFNSGVTIPASDIYNRCGLPQVTNSSNPKVTAAGYQNFSAPSLMISCRVVSPATTVEVLKAKTAAVVHDKQAFGQGVAESLRASSKSAEARYLLLWRDRN